MMMVAARAAPAAERIIGFMQISRFRFVLIYRIVFSARFADRAACA